VIFRYLILHADLFKDFQQHVSEHQSNDDNTNKIDGLLMIKFPRLVCVLVHTRKITVREDDSGEPIAMTAELHIYGSVTPPELVFACRYRHPYIFCDESSDESEYSGNDDSRYGDDTSSYSETVTECDIDINLLVLHKNASFKMDGQDQFVYPSVGVWFEAYGRTLDLRLLAKSNTFLQETLAGTAWLLNEGRTSCERCEGEPAMHETTRVLSSSEMIQPVVKTV
jgi:hypothetical protein